MSGFKVRHYRLNGNGDPEECSVLEAEAWRLENDAHIASDEVGRFWISTVLLSVTVGDPPLMFETMIFEDGETFDRRNYGTREEALRGHAAFLAVLSGTNN